MDADGFWAGAPCQEEVEPPVVPEEATVVGGLSCTGQWTATAADLHPAMGVSNGPNDDVCGNVVAISVYDLLLLYPLESFVAP